MDKILEKFGIYDLFGIWFPGVITTTYFFFTLYDVLIFILPMIASPLSLLSPSQILGIMYSVVAYTIGVILHELGKVIVERHKCFYPNSVIKIFKSNAIDKEPGWRIRKEQKDIVNSIIPKKEYNEEYFHTACTHIKYDKDFNSQKTNKYHSIYALSRSLTLCFSLHFAIYPLVYLLGLILQITSFSLLDAFVRLIITITDMLLSILFSIRTYRYYIAWIKNTIVQYYLILHTPDTPPSHYIIQINSDSVELKNT